MARSRELTGAVAFAAGLAALAACVPSTLRGLLGWAQGSLRSAGTSSAAPADLVADATLGFAMLAAPLLLAPALAGGLVALIQAGFVVSFDPLRPRAERLDPAKGLRRLCSTNALRAALLGLAKATTILWLAWDWVGSNGRVLAALPRLGPAGLWRALPVGPLTLRLALLALGFGVVDFVLARRRHLRSLRMTRDEVRREARQDEGDPQHRAERRRIHRDLLEAGPVATATVVVVNPTHVAVALRHRRGAEEAPRLLAKGTGEAASRIRSEARRAGVPIVRDVALARAVARLVDVGEEIPTELYEAAAAVLAHVYGTNGVCR